MTISDDMQLVKEYASGNSEEAFAVLVSRYVNLVYSAALRRVNNTSAAEEITQSVFLLLAQKARALNSATILSGWLYQAACHTASNFLRSEIRRQNREQEAFMQSNLNEPEPDLWREIRPILDEAMASLGDTDRNAIVLRFFENKPMKDVGAALGASEDAAKMRVSRAVEKLREFFARRGVTLSSAGLVAAIEGNSVQAAPAGLAATVIVGVGKGAAAGAAAFTISKGAIQLMSWTKISAAIGAAALVFAAAEWKQAATERQAAEHLRAQLREQANVNEAQLTQISNLDQQNESMRKQMSMASHDVAKARNKNSMAIAAAIAAAKAANNKSRLGDMFKDPAMMEMMRKQSAIRIQKQYGALVKQLQLTPDQTDKFYQILTDRSLNNVARGADLLNSGDLSALKQASKEMQQQTDDSIRALLGDAGFTQYQAYESTMPDRLALDQMKPDFADDPLTADQQKQLLDTMTSVRKSVSASNPDIGSKFSITDPAAAMERTLGVQETINQQVLEQAAGFLSPNQLQILGTSQTNYLDMTKAGYAVAQSMFNSNSNAAK